MDNAYEIYLQEQRALVVSTAQEKGLDLMAEDLREIRAPQILLEMTTEDFLKALREDHLTIGDVQQMYTGFCEYYANVVATERESTNDVVVDEMSGDKWSIVRAEEDAVNFIRVLLGQHMESLINDKYVMKDFYHYAKNVGPQTVNLLDIDLLQAVREGRVRIQEIRGMSGEEWETAEPYNPYPRF